MVPRTTPRPLVFELATFPLNVGALLSDATGTAYVTRGGYRRSHH